MLPFLAGTIAGWTAARILPPPSEAADRIKPPTLNELQLLAVKSKHFMEQIQKKINEEESPG